MTQRVGFGWYGDRANGIERLRCRTDETRRSASWFMHRLPARTEAMLDLSSDPVISLEINPSGAIERAVDGHMERAFLSTDTLTLTPALATCEWRWSGTPFDILDVYIPNEIFQAACSDHVRGDPALVNLAPRLMLYEPGLMFLLRSMITCNIADERSNNLFFETLTSHLALYLLCMQPAATTISKRPIGALPMAALRRVKAHIEDNLAEELTLDDLACVAGVSRFHFARQFRAVVGETPHGYVVRRRLERSRNMLTESRLSIGDVAAACGFSDPSHYAKRFRREFKVAPGDYRRING